MKQTSTKRVQNRIWLGGKGDPLGIVQDNYHNTKWYMHNPESVLEYEMNKIHLDFKIPAEHLIPVRKPDFPLIKKERVFTV